VGFLVLIGIGSLCAVGYALAVSEHIAEVPTALSFILPDPVLDFVDFIIRVLRFLAGS